MIQALAIIAASWPLATAFVALSLALVGGYLIHRMTGKKEAEYMVLDERNKNLERVLTSLAAAQQTQTTLLMKLPKGGGE